MIAVADASPICYLILIREIDLLPQLFSGVLLPRDVLDELSVEAAPPEVRSWASAPPAWVTVADGSPEFQPDLERLQKGERAAILLAESKRADVVLLDDKSARRTADERGLQVIGLLGLLVEAANRKLVDLPTAIDRLTKTSFRYSPLLLRSVLERFHY